VDMTLHRFFTWFDDGLETKGPPMRMSSRMGFSHGKLPYCVG